MSNEIKSKLSDKADFGTPLVFVHVPKTAGSSVTNAMRRCLGKQNVYRAGQHEPINAFHDLQPAEILKYKGFSGHIIYPKMREICGPDAHYFSILREPIDRVISLHAHIARVSSHREHEYAKQGLSVWLELLEGDPYLQLLATQDWFIRPHGANLPDDIVFGQQERLNEFLEELGLPAPLSVNTSKNRVEISAQHRKRIEKLFAEDFELYEMAKI